MNCVFCGGKLEQKKVTFAYNKDDKHFLVENVPAQVCEKCGEQTYSPEVTDELLKRGKANTEGVRIIEVRVFDFTEV